MESGGAPPPPGPHRQRSHRQPCAQPLDGLAPMPTVPTWWASEGGRCPSSTPSGTVAEHMACRTDVAVFDVSHLGTVRLAGPDARPALQRALTNDLAKVGPGKAQYTHLLDEDGSVLDDLIVWWTGEESFDVMPNASNTSRVLAAIGGTDVTAERAVAGRPGASVPGPDGGGPPRGRDRRPLRGTRARRGRASRGRGRHRLHGRGRGRVRRACRCRRSPCGKPSSPPGPRRPAWALATPSASRPACPCTAMNWARA